VSTLIGPAEDLLRAIGAAPTAPIDLAEAALALAVLEAVPSGLDRYRKHLALMAENLAEVAQGARGVAEQVSSLGLVMVERLGYRGDTEGYDALENANLLHVIDRRRGLPVALGILFIHAARSQGWRAGGLAFPGHFLIRIEGADGRAIVDPFHEGRSQDAAALRRLLKAMAGEQAEVSEEHCALVSDRDVLLRLQNNIKLRLIAQERYVEAGRTLDRMLLMAPEDSGLWQEAAVIQAEIGAIDRAQSAIDAALGLPISDASRAVMQTLRQRLRRSLH
jgi:regulator of sirC expression with transglutaminase-like and TPR domain